MITDEIVIDRTLYVGSEGNRLVRYYLTFNRQHTDVIDNLTFDDLKKLSRFLNEYIKETEEGGVR